MTIRSIAIAAVAGLGLFTAVPAQANDTSNAHNLRLNTIHAAPIADLSTNGSGLVHEAGFRSHKGFHGHKGFRGHRGFHRNRGFSRHRGFSKHKRFGHSRFRGHRGHKFSKFHHRKFRRF